MTERTDETTKQTKLTKQGKEKKRTGPVKGKAQVTLRLDDQLMAEVNAQLKDDGARLTDAAERGLILWLEESRHKLPSWTKQTRFITANSTAKQEELIRGAAIRMVENEIEPRSEDGEMIWKLCEQYLRSANSLPHAKKCLDLYQRYGKREEERTK